MYTIKQAAARTGLSIPTIRAWERRYGVVSPTRTPAGYRLYDDAAIERLTAMRALVESDGWRPSQAAERIATPGLDLAVLAAAPAPDRTPVGDDRPAHAADRSGGAHRGLRGGCEGPRHRPPGADPRRGLRGPTVRARHGRRWSSRPSVPSVVAWAAGDLDVGAEHGASETVRRRLAHFFDAARGPMMHVQALVGMPPAGQHELGAFAFAIACRRAGLSVAFLGMDVPLASWLRMARETAVPAIVFGAVTGDDAAGVNGVVEALRKHGPAAGLLRRWPGLEDARIASDAVRLPSSLDEAVAVVAASLATDEVEIPLTRPLDGYAPCIPTGTRAAAAIPRAPSARSPHHPKVTFPNARTRPRPARSARTRTADLDAAPPSVAAARPSLNTKNSRSSRPPASGTTSRSAISAR